jgi:hypothetical protein
VEIISLFLKCLITRDTPVLQYLAHRVASQEKFFSFYLCGVLTDLDMDSTCWYLACYIRAYKPHNFFTCLNTCEPNFSLLYFSTSSSSVYSFAFHIYIPTPTPNSPGYPAEWSLACHTNHSLPYSPFNGFRNVRNWMYKN